MGRDHIRYHTDSYGEEYDAKLKECLSIQGIWMGDYVRFGSIPPREPPAL